MILLILMTMIIMVVSFYPHHHHNHNHNHHHREQQHRHYQQQQQQHHHQQQHLDYYNDPEIETIRQQLYSNLKTKLYQGIRRAGCDSRRGWLKAFEKWQFISKLTEPSHHTNYSTIANNIANTTSKSNDDNSNVVANITPIDLYDPLIPCMLPTQYNVAYIKLKEYLSKLENMPKADADVVALELTVESYNQVIKISDFLKSKQLKNKNNNNKNNNNDIKISYDNSTDLFYLSLVKDSKKLNEYLDYKNNLVSMGIASIKIGNTKTLYKRWLDFANKESYTSPPPAFYRDLYILLLRYKSLEGYGWQAAIPDPVFHVLSKQFNVTTECFASPLNAYLPNYCSVFQDSDKPFGSLGSFFDQTFNEGCYEANPPFTPELFEVMVNHMNQLLDQATGPLAFIIFAPAWIDDPHWILLKNAKYYKHSFIVSSTNHTYCDGAFHKQPKVLDESNASKYRPAPFDTGIVIFANEMGIEKWPITAEAEESIKQAFSAAKPSLASLERSQQKGKYIPKKNRQST